MHSPNIDLPQICEKILSLVSEFKEPSIDFIAEELSLPRDVIAKIAKYLYTQNKIEYIIDNQSLPNTSPKIKLKK